MFILNNKRINIYAPFVDANGVKYRNLVDPVIRTSMGVTEIPEPDVPVGYDPELWFRTETDEAPYVIYTQKSQEQIDTILAERARITAEEQLKADMKADAFVQNFIAMSLADVGNYVDTNVTDLASARQLLKRMSQMILLLAKREYRINPNETLP